MTSNYALGVLIVFFFVTTFLAWHLYKDAIKRDIATSEVLCSVLLSPYLRSEVESLVKERIAHRFPPEVDPPSELELQLLKNDLLSAIGDYSLRLVTSAGPGATLVRVLASVTAIAHLSVANPADRGS